MMLQLYFWPMACSLASRIALMEAGVDARYHPVDIFNKKILENALISGRFHPRGPCPCWCLKMARS
jgi:glutathione S-transferase